MNILEEHKIGLTQLTDLFELNKRQYNTYGYDEANTRTDFIRAEGLIPYAYVVTKGIEPDCNYLNIFFFGGGILCTFRT